MYQNQQKGFVAANDVSIVEAYITITANGFAFPFGIYDGEIPIGFIMIGYDVDDYWDNAPYIARGNYNLWRLMIDQKYQKKGFGREAIALGLNFVKSFPCGKAESTAGCPMSLTMRLLVNYIIHLVLLKPAIWMEMRLLQY